MVNTYTLNGDKIWSLESLFKEWLMLQTIILELT